MMMKKNNDSIEKRLKSKTFFDDRFFSSLDLKIEEKDLV